MEIVVYAFGTVPSLALEGWDFESDAIDYRSQRALALYEALGADPEDYEYSLAQHRDGRWGLFGMTVEGHPFAVERAYKCALCGDRADYSAELGLNGLPIWGLRDEGGTQCGPCGDWHRWVSDD